jgi:hypothetical protein
VALVQLEQFTMSNESHTTHDPASTADALEEARSMLDLLRSAVAASDGWTQTTVFGANKLLDEVDSWIERAEKLIFEPVGSD